MLACGMGAVRWALGSACLLVMFGCAERKAADSTPPSGEATTRGSSTGTAKDPNCPAGGPSVSLNIRRPGGEHSSQHDQGALLGWIGGFVQPCIDEPSEAPAITLVFHLGEAGEAPVLEFVERESLPTMAACLDEGFAGAGEPPPGPMDVSIVVPWGCPTLPPGYGAQAESSDAP